MIIRIDTNSDTIALEEPTDFHRLKAVVSGPADEARMTRLLGTRGAAENGHVHLEPSAFRSLAGNVAHEPGWAASLEKMLDYARSKGWCDERGRVLAHIERG
jgi:hypothetical protein